MDEMNTMNEVMNTEETTNMVPAQDDNYLVMTEDNSSEEDSGKLGAMLVVGAVALGGYVVGKIGEKLVKKVGPKIKAKFGGPKKHKAETEESEPVDVELEATEVEEPEEKSK